METITATVEGAAALTASTGALATVGPAGAVAVHADAAPGSMMNFIEMAVRDNSIDVTKLDALLRMQREVAADDAKAQFFRALHAAQAEMPKVKKNGTIDLGEDKATGKARGSIPFATWEDVNAFCRPIWTAHGFSVTFSNSEKTELGLKFVATYRHVAGHSEQNYFTLPPDSGPGRNALQAVGSTSGYAKRYLVEGFFNIVREGQDDDGKRGGTAYIGDDLVEKIKAALTARKIRESEFLEAMGVQSLGEIEKKHETLARNVLKQWQARQPAERP